MSKKPKSKYRAKVGLSYLDKRYEEGELIDDLPKQSAEWLLAQGHIEAIATEGKDD